MSNIHDFMQARDKFEPDCVIGEGDTEPYLISIAISLERIADALESQANIAATTAAYAPASHDLRSIDEFDA